MTLSFTTTCHKAIVQRCRRQFQRQIAAAGVSAVDDGAAVGVSPAGADQELRHLFDGLLRRRQSDPGHRPPRERTQAFQRQRQMGAPLVAGDRVYLIDDHGAASGEHVPTRLRTQ